MKPNRVVWIDRGWQPAAIGFVPGREAWDSLIKSHKIEKPFPDPGINCGTTTWLVNDVTGEAMILVTLNPSAERAAIDVILTLVHEAVHVWQFIADHMGEQSPGIETEAYAIQHISEGLINAYCATQGKDRKWL